MQPMLEHTKFYFFELKFEIGISIKLNFLEKKLRISFYYFSSTSQWIYIYN